ncbi:MAG: LysR family transcriptional regulator, partial [Pseudomonadota bacterium]
MRGRKNLVSPKQSIWLSRTMTLDLKSLELFVRIATVGAIGKAGSEFGLSRTSASQRIQALETDVGV